MPYDIVYTRFDNRDNLSLILSKISSFEGFIYIGTFTKKFALLGYYCYCNNRFGI